MGKNFFARYYAPGMISLVFLPIICIIHLFRTDSFTNYGSLDLTMWDGKKDQVNYDLLPFLKSKKFEAVNFTGNYDSDLKKLKEAQLNIRDIISAEDSARGIKFHFGPKAQYQTFVSTINVFAVENAPFYVPYKNDIWFCNPRKPKNTSVRAHDFGGGLFGCYAAPQEPAIFESLAANAKSIVTKFWLPILVYLLMVFLALRKLRFIRFSN